MTKMGSNLSITTGSKYHKTIVEARYQHDAKKIAQAQIPSARICGGPRQL